MLKEKTKVDFHSKYKFLTKTSFRDDHSSRYKSVVYYEGAVLRHGQELQPALMEVSESLSAPWKIICCGFIPVSLKNKT